MISAIVVQLCMFVAVELLSDARLKLMGSPQFAGAKILKVSYRTLK